MLLLGGQPEAQHLSGQTFASQTFAIGLSCDQPHGFEHGDVLADISVAGSSRGTGGTTSSLPAQHIDHVFALQSAAPAILVEQGAARLLARAVGTLPAQFAGEVSNAFFHQAWLDWPWCRLL